MHDSQEEEKVIDIVSENIGREWGRFRGTLKLIFRTMICHRSYVYFPNNDLSINRRQYYKQSVRCPCVRKKTCSERYRHLPLFSIQGYAAQLHPFPRDLPINTQQ